MPFDLNKYREDQSVNKQENGNDYPLLREPFESEHKYFKENPNVAGMATEDDKVIINPYTKNGDPNDAKFKKSIYDNESTRIKLRKSDKKHDFKLTKEQKEAFKDYGSDQDIRDTILARIVAGDESALNATDEQKKIAETLKQSSDERNIQEVQKGQEEAAQRNYQPPFKQPEQFELDKYKEESTPEFTRRKIASTAADIGSEIAGVPFDLENFAGDFFKNVFEKGEIPKPDLSLGTQDYWENLMFADPKDKKKLQEYKESNKKLEKEIIDGTPSWLKNFLKQPGIVGTLGLIDPELKGKELGAEKIREQVGKATGGYTLPQSPGEKVWQDAVKGFTNLTVASGGKNIVMNLGKAAAGEAVKAGAKAFGASETEQEWLKQGTYLGLGMLKPNLLRNEAADARAKAMRAITPNTMVPTNNLLANLQIAKQKIIDQGDPKQPWKIPVLEAMDRLEAQASGGSLPFESLANWYKEQNTALGNKDLFNNLDSQQRKLLKNNFESFKNVLREDITAYGKNMPGFLDNWNKANELYRSVFVSNHAMDQVRNSIHLTHTAPATAILLNGGTAMYGLPLVSSLAATGAAGMMAATSLGGYTLARRAWESPLVRQLYRDVMVNAVKENSVELLKSIKRLDEEVLKIKEKKTNKG